MMLNSELKEDLAVRLQRIQSTLREQGADACLLTTNVNIFYATGGIYTGFCYIPVEGKPLHFIKSPNSEVLENSVLIHKPEQITTFLAERNILLPKNIFLEIDAVPYSSIIRLQHALGNPAVQNASVLLRRIRSIKTPYEINQIRLCARRHEAVYAAISSVFCLGMTDIQLQIEIERLMRLHGSIGEFRGYGENMEIFMGSLLAGDNAQAPSPFDFALGGAGISPVVPLGANGSVIEHGQTIMVDMAGNFTPWMTDMTRVFSVGKTSELAYRAHQVSMDIHHKIQDEFKVGTACAALYETAEKMVKNASLTDYFMGTVQQAKFVGHGLGLEINEPPVLTPRSKDFLEKNTVFALEPKFVIPGIGAVGIENTYLVTENGLETITCFEEPIIELS